MPDSEYVTASQVAAHLKISERTVRRRCEAGKLAAKLEATHGGKAWLIEAAALEGAANSADTADKLRTGAAIGADTQNGPPEREYSPEAPQAWREGADTAAKVRP